MNDVMRLDVKSLVWEKLETSGDVPSPRAGHIGVLVCSDNLTGYSLLNYFTVGGVAVCTWRLLRSGLAHPTPTAGNQ